MQRIYKRATARCDLVEHYVYLAENASLEIADRFLKLAEETFNDLAQHPDIGAPVNLRAPELAGIRKWQIDEFKRHLIFYLPSPDGVSIVRVLHSSQDWWSLLGIDVD